MRDDKAGLLPTGGNKKGTLAAVLTGNALEYFDFTIFAFFALQIGMAFFPGDSAQHKLVLSLAAFGAGFLTRPLGGIVLGALADRRGRESALRISFILMGLSIFGIAITPPYAAIGVAAPIIVIGLRLVQGFVLGGTTGAASAYIFEQAPVHRRGFFMAIQCASQAMAIILSGLLGTLLTSSLGQDALNMWGWRLALMLGAAITPIGLLLGQNLRETNDRGPDDDEQSFPRYRAIMLPAIPLFGFGTITMYAINYMTSYAQTSLAMGSDAAFRATIVVGVTGLLASPVAGLVSDRIGRKPLIAAGAVILLVAAFPAFWLLIRWKSEATLYGVSALLMLGQAIAVPALLVALAEGLPRRVRATGFGLIYAVTTALFAGTTQVAIAWLIGTTGSAMVPAWYLMGAAMVGLSAWLFLPETAPSRSKSHT